MKLRQRKLRKLQQGLLKLKKLTRHSKKVEVKKVPRMLMKIKIRKKVPQMSKKQMIKPQLTPLRMLMRLHPRNQSLKTSSSTAQKTQKPRPFSRPYF
jgi:hypothetical protein